MISAPAHNNELPHLIGYNQKMEDELFANQKTIAASATAVCLTADTLRSTVEDLKDSIRDFEEGQVEDPAREVPRIMSAVAALLEEGAMASIFGATTLSKS